MTNYRDQYLQALLQDVIPFWERYSIDEKYGGYFTCLNADGVCYDTDKFIWLQARQVWTFSMLYQRLEQRPEWLHIATQGANFLKAHAFAPNGDCYFALDRQGHPLVAPYNIFSDCFVTMAFSIYGAVSGEESYTREALRLFNRILERAPNPKGQYSKAISGNRSLKNFALPMILCNLSLELADLLPPTQVEATISACTHEILDHFLDKEKLLLLENVGPEGQLVDTFDGRLLNPGHGIEACWFLLDIAERRNDMALAKHLTNICLSILQHGWDDEHGGIFYFLDQLGHPPQQLEWDQKLWWVHLETLIALLKAYRLTGNATCLDWFRRVHDYTWSHFPDKRGGLEWFGYLNRRGEVLLPLKGGKWKGCFHVPRALFLCYRELDRMSDLPV